MATHWTREWYYLLPKAQRVPMDPGYSRLEMVARVIYNQGVGGFLKDYMMLK
jgi:hypothetical protein